jgi:hypothetical protein
MSHEDRKLGAEMPLPRGRWVARRKAMVVTALREGGTTFEEVCHLYSLSPDELASWISDFDRYGLPGLRSTRVQLYRQLEKDAGRPGPAPRRTVITLRNGQFR